MTYFKIHPQDLRCLAKSDLEKSWNSVWVESKSVKGKQYASIQPNIPRKPWFFIHKKSVRWVTSTISRLRIGHACTPVHLTKIRVRDHSLCECGLDEGSVSHILFSCPKLPFNLYDILPSKIPRPLNAECVLMSVYSRIMHILCTICSDLVNQADNLIVTKCGHIFHHNCLSKWIERSKSCPQCRNKVTESGLYRLFPTISSETEVDDVITLQSRLDDALLQLRQSHATCKENVEKCAKAEAQLAKVMTQLKTSEKQLESRETAIAAMKEQLKYLKMEITVVENLKDENEGLKKNMRTLNGLQKVLNATSEEVELMLEGYSDVRTVATFATALKRALCESESKKNDTRDRLQVTKQKLAAEKSIVADLQAKLASAEEKLSLLHRKYRGLQQKRKSDVLESSLAEESPSSAKKMRQDLNAAVLLTDSCNNSFNTMVDKIENAESPYLRLQQSSLALSALNLASQHANPAKPLSDKNLKPSEYALLNSVRNAITKKPEANKSQATSIFQKKEPTKINFTQENDPNLSLLNISYDGLGGHSKLDTFPVPNSKPNFKSCIPKLSAKHKLKRPNPVGSQDIGKMLEKIRDK